MTNETKQYVEDIWRQGKTFDCAAFRSQLGSFFKKMLDGFEHLRAAQERPGALFTNVFRWFYDDFVKITSLNKYNEQIRNKHVKITNKTKQCVEDVWR